MARTFQPGDQVIVHDPRFERDFPGTVESVSETGIYIEGPHLEQDSRIWTWDIRHDVAEQYVRPVALPAPGQGS